MAILTAQILIGRGHPKDGGINPTNYLYLSENSRPALILVNQNVIPKLRGEQSFVGKRTWIPTVENTLEDALVMISYYVCQTPSLIEMVKSLGVDVERNHFCLYDLSETQRQKLYAICKAIDNDHFPKLIISVFKGAHFERQLAVLDDYRMGLEVCVSGYSRDYSAFTNTFSYHMDND